MTPSEKAMLVVRAVSASPRPMGYSSADGTAGKTIRMTALTPSITVVFGLVVGGAYLLIVGGRLVPARVHPEEDLTERFRMREYLSRVFVRPESPLAGHPLRDLELDEEYDLDILQVVREAEVFLVPTTDQELQAGDLLVIRAQESTLAAFCQANRLEPHRLEAVSDDTFVDRKHSLLEITLAPDSELAGETLVSSNFRNRYAGTVLGVTRGDHVTRDRIEHFELNEGDSLLVLVSREKIPVLEAEPGLVVTRLTPADAFRETPSGQATGDDGGRSRGGVRPWPSASWPPWF